MNLPSHYLSDIISWHAKCQIIKDVKKAKISQDPNNNSSVSVREAHMPNS